MITESRLQDMHAFVEMWDINQSFKKNKITQKKNPVEWPTHLERTTADLLETV